MTFSHAFQVEGWICRREGVRHSGVLVSLQYVIDVPANDGTLLVPYRFAMHDLGEGFIATDFSPLAWRERPDRFSGLTSHAGLHVDFRHLVRVCFGIFLQEVLPNVPLAIFVVCGSRTIGEMSGPLCGGGTKKYHLYRSIFVRLASDGAFRLVDDISHSLFFVCPPDRVETPSDLLTTYWRRRARIDSLLGGAP